MLLIVKRTYAILLISACLICAACAEENTVRSDPGETGGNTAAAGTETTGYYDGVEDQYGIVLNAAFSSAFIFNFGEIQVRSGRDGFEINLYSEEIANKLGSVMDLALSDGAYLTTAGGNPQYKIFDDGNALFKPYGSDPNLLRLHEFDIGYLPYPKYDEAQPDYVVWSAGGLMAVPICAEDIGRTGAVIEALSAASDKYVKDAFIETYVENKILRDAESQQIYRMMRDKATYDLSYNIDPSGKLSDYKYYSYFFTKKSSDVTSYYASVGQQIEEKYAELFAFVSDTEE